VNDTDYNAIADLNVPVTITVVDEYDNDQNIETFSQKAGTYTVTYSLTDYAFHTGPLAIQVTINDSVKPVIVLKELNGQVDMSIDEGVPFSDPGVESVTDEFDYPLLLSISDVEIDIPLDIADVGSHTIRYSVTDKAGRVGYASRTVTVNSLIPLMDWAWPFPPSGDAKPELTPGTMVADLKDYHPKLGGGEQVVGGYDDRYPISHAGDSIGTDEFYYNAFVSANGYGVYLENDYVDFIFTFVDDNTWCSGYRQYGGISWGTLSFSKDIEIYTSNANFGPWALVATDSHDAWHNNSIGTFTDGVTTEWTPSTPSKYLLVRTKSNHGNPYNGGVLSVRFIQLKLGVL
jgi:hypothetical protein